MVAVIIGEVLLRAMRIFLFNNQPTGNLLTVMAQYVQVSREQLRHKFSRIRNEGLSANDLAALEIATEEGPQVVPADVVADLEDIQPGVLANVVAAFEALHAGAAQQVSPLVSVHISLGDHELPVIRKQRRRGDNVESG